MSRPTPAGLADVLTSSMEVTYSADLIYGARRIFQDLPIIAPSFRWDSSAQVEGSGSVTVVWTDDHGSSLKPRDPQDWLAPFGARLIVFCRVTAGDYSARLQLGDYTIDAVPSADDEAFILGETRITVGSRVDLALKDRMVEVQRDRFTGLASPTSLASVWSEVALLVGLPVTRTLPDAAITRSVVYEEDRVSAVCDLLSILGGEPFMEWDGTLSARSITAGSPVAALTIGEQGTIIKVGSALSADGVYNGIIIRGETDGQSPILTELWINEGPLAATARGGERTPFHRVPRFYSSPFIATQAQAQAAAPALLEQFSQARASSLQVQCIIDPRRQVGDVVTIQDDDAIWTMRIVKLDMGEGPYMTVEGDVISRVFR